MATNPELNPRHPVTGKFTTNPATGKGHIELSSADHAASIPGTPSKTEAHFKGKRL